VYEFPGATAKLPKLDPLSGWLTYVVPWVAGLVNCVKVICPLPDVVKLDVCKSACLGNKKVSVQVLPEYEAGMSKLKIEQVVLSTLPK
jgi:hypothetical protein